MWSIEAYVSRQMKEKRLSQTALAGELGLSVQHLNDILRGRRPVRVVHITPLCRALECEPNELLGWEKENHQITVTDDDGQVIALITGDRVVEHEGYHVSLA